MEIRRYVEIDEKKIQQSETRMQMIEDLIKEIQAGTVQLTVENGNLVQINCTQQVRY